MAAGPSQDKNKKRAVGPAAPAARAQTAGTNANLKVAKPRPKTTKAATAVDLDKQCGVPLPTGGLCGRSLTCKTHSMGAKRAVKGRSQPYDVLLAAHHQQKHVKQVYKSARAQLDEENEANKPSEPVSEQEEIQLVLKGVLQSQPLPLDRKVLISTRSRQRFLQMRELLFGSVTRIPSLGTGTEAGGLGGAMNATGAFLGRTLIYDPATGTKYARPSRIFARRLAIAQHQQAQAQAQAQAAAQAQAQGRSNAASPAQQAQSQAQSQAQAHASQAAQQKLRETAETAAHA